MSCSTTCQNKRKSSPFVLLLVTLICFDVVISYCLPQTALYPLQRWSNIQLKIDDHDIAGPETNHDHFLSGTCPVCIPRCQTRAWWILRSWDRASLMYSSITNKMQRYTMVFITINTLHVPGGSSAHHQELKSVHTASGICRDFSASYSYREWDGTAVPTHSRYTVLSSWWWAGEPPETCSAFIVINTIV
jgi:hypothetical protein